MKPRLMRSRRENQNIDDDSEENGRTTGPRETTKKETEIGDPDTAERNIEICARRELPELVILRGRMPEKSDDIPTTCLRGVRDTRTPATLVETA